MRPFITITRNTFMELLRQPVFLLLATAAPAFIIVLSALPYFGFGQDPKLVRDGALAVTLLTGLFGAVISASASVAQEIRSGTALAVLSKPVDRLSFLLGKYCGIAAAITLLTYCNLLATLLASRMAYDAYGDMDLLGTSLFFGGMALAYGIGAIANYFHHRNYVSDTFFCLLGLMTVVFICLAFFIELRDPAGNTAKQVDWRLIPAGLLILFAILILCGIALACSTRLETVPTLIICSLLFLLGLMSDHLFRAAAESGNTFANVAYAAVPNWQLFWIADAIEADSPLPDVWTYIGKSLGYLAGYLGTALILAYLLFENRELNAE
ncbi:MAG: ABC transporter permease [Verrucomicrobiia bacterium]|jgi:ABC-type transport system involved in multi-copper enzyme maturation permease subunit